MKPPNSPPKLPQKSAHFGESIQSINSTNSTLPTTQSQSQSQ